MVCYLASLSGAASASVSAKGTAYDRRAVGWTAAALAWAVTSALSSEEGELALWALVALDISRLSSQQTSLQSPGESSEEGDATAATQQASSCYLRSKINLVPPSSLQPVLLTQLQHLRSCLLCYPCRKNAKKWREHGAGMLAMFCTHAHTRHFSHACTQAFCFSPRVPPWRRHWRFVRQSLHKRHSSIHVHCQSLLSHVHLCVSALPHSLSSPTTSPCRQVAVSFVRLTLYGALPPSVLSLLSPIGLLAVAPRVLSATALSLVWPSPTLLRGVLDTNAPLTLRMVNTANDTQRVRDHLFGSE